MGPATAPVGTQGASAIRNLLIRNVEAGSAMSWLRNRDPRLPRGRFRPLGSSPEKCERFLKFSVFQFSTFSPEVRTIFENFEFSTFRSEEIGHPQRDSRVRNSGSRANSEVSYQTGDLYCSVASEKNETLTSGPMKHLLIPTASSDK